MRDISDRSIVIKAGNKWRGLTFRACTFCIGGGAYLEKTQNNNTREGIEGCEVIQRGQLHHGVKQPCLVFIMPHVPNNPCP